MDELPPTLPTSAGEAHDGATYGRFIPLGVLGRGGMGVVLRARDPELDREVAIKVLTSTSDDGAKRLRREAQAMAKLSHPNVVHVYEIGQLGEGRFIVMEIVEGTTLRTWLETARPQRDIVDAFVACGRGLEAAHAAGIVHRDFKPENVLIGADGRPRVTDFGLVGIEAAIAGTPGYMAPEQWLGESVDARTDVFAFCVALWEALYKARPFEDPDDPPDKLRARVLAGDLRDHDESAVDAAIEEVLRRGLARDRDQRWQSMTPLLAALDRKPVRRWPWLAGGVLVAGAIAGGMAIGSADDAVEPCPEPQLAAVWDADVEAKLVAAFRTASPALAAETSTRVIAALGGYAKQWREASVAACRATNVEGAQSPELLDRRMQCLERRKAELAQLTTSFATATEHTRVATAVEAVGRLGDVEQCADREMLLAAAPPSDPAQRAKVEALDLEIMESQALEGRVSAAQRQEAAAKLVARARTLEYAPVLVRALDAAYDAASDNGDQPATEAYLRELAQRAAETHEDGRSARAWMDLGRLFAESRRIGEAKVLEPVAEAAIARAGNLSQLRYVQYATIGVRKLHGQDIDGALEAFTASEKFADTDDRRAPIQLMLAQVANIKGGPRAALPLARTSLETSVRAYGKDHPQVAKTKMLIAQLLLDDRDLAGATAMQAEVIASREAVFGPKHRDVAMALQVAAKIARASGKLADAKPLAQRAIEIFDGDRGVVDAGTTRGVLAQVTADLDGIAAARPIYTRALADLATVGRDQVNYIGVEVDFAYRLLEAQLCPEAQPYLEHAISELADKRPRQLPQVLEASAQCDVGANKVERAIAKLEHALTMCGDNLCPIDVAPMVAFKLGRLLLELRREVPRARALLAAAKSEATKANLSDLLEDIAHWEKAMTAAGRVP